ncbi:GNAT family N-acetyltransferase [Maledivibacter halophilus]|uniref:Putative acetyltransferase n=1 Tax=Maledivibacter halophilus TaxID=36842 RepID=A0A1T5L1B0_9FIRM|nr:GNAT family N-acetyltransferase [Maledivibacter halophilus]SKC69188.1 putative acetyltransferase [Maledivibacter halophilus]
MEIRKYCHGEESQLMDIFVSSIRKNAKSFYSEIQLESWAPDNMNSEKWKEKIQRINPYVIVDKDMILGYADLQDNGYIDHFFIRGGYSGRGIGKLLMSHIIEEAKRKKILELTSDVSLAAQAFFEKFGFNIVKRKSVQIRGIELENALMSKKMTEECI